MEYKLTAFIVWISISLNAQHFSGEIEYEMKIVPKKENLNVDSIWSLKPGKKARYLITSSFYKSTYYNDSTETYSYTYDNVSKKMYDDQASLPYITFRDSRRANFTYGASEIYRDSIVDILGRECFMVKNQSDFGNSTTYYSEDIKVDYESFKDHQVGNWYNKLKEVDGCVSIKTITEFDDYYEIQEAVKITPLDLDQKDFELNMDKIIVASYSALDKNVELIPPNQESIECYREKHKSGIAKKDVNEPVICYLSFVINRKGELSYLTPVEDIHGELNEIAVDILKNCGLKFSPGEINGRAVSSLAYFPVEF